MHVYYGQYHILPLESNVVLPVINAHANLTLEDIVEQSNFLLVLLELHLIIESLKSHMAPFLDFKHLRIVLRLHLNFKS